MASDPDRFTQVAEELLADFDFVELNCGCPSPKVYKHGAGSQLLCDPDYFQKFIETATQRLGPQKLAVKIRLGIQQHSEAFRLLEIASLFKLKKLTIHGRTKVQGYKGSANWGVIDFAADKLPFKVVGSGDIVDCQSYKVRTLHSQVDSVIIGRGAMKNPWIFSEILGRFQTHVSNNHLQEILTVYYLLQIAKVRGLSPQVFSELNFNISGEVEEFWSANCRKILALLQIASKDNLPYCRPSFGRLKMIWTHIRYRTCENPENMAAALRTSDPNIFFTKMKELRKDFSMSLPSQSFILG
jgi:tRNA-dihydrouridine synthase